MARSDAERATNDAIETALLAYRDAYAAAHPEARVGALVDWIVVAAEVVPGATPDEDVTAYSIIMPGGGIPAYRAAGLLEMGKGYVTTGSEEE